MKLTDLDDPSVFREALARGLGRCVLWLRAAGGFGPHRDALLDAFGRNLAFDPQCEGTRVSYLFDLAEAASMEGELRAAALAGLVGVDDRWEADQHAAVALALARGGDEAAEEALRAGFEGAPTKGDVFDSFSWALVQLDGVEGFLRVARRLGAEPAGGDRVGNGEYLRTVADDLAGAEAVGQALAEAAAGDPAIAAFVEAVRASEERPAAAPAPSVSLDAMVAEARAREARGQRFMGGHAWGRRATAQEQGKAVELLGQTAEVWLQGLLLRALPRDAAVPMALLLRLAGAEDERVVDGAVRRLARVEAPEVREYIERALGADPPGLRAIRALASNRRPGDGDRVAALLPGAPAGAEDAHGLCLDLLEAFSGAGDAAAPMRWIYEHSPCSCCRHSAVVALDELDALPEGLSDECCFDCNDETRELMQGQAPSAGEG